MSSITSLQLNNTFWISNGSSEVSTGRNYEEALLWTLDHRSRIEPIKDGTTRVSDKDSAYAYFNQLAASLFGGSINASNENTLENVFNSNRAAIDRIKTDVQSLSSASSFSDDGRAMTFLRGYQLTLLVDLGFRILKTESRRNSGDPYKDIRDDMSDMYTSTNDSDTFPVVLAKVSDIYNELIKNRTLYTSDDLINNSAELRSIVSSYIDIINDSKLTDIEGSQFNNFFNKLFTRSSIKEELTKFLYQILLENAQYRYKNERGQSKLDSSISGLEVGSYLADVSDSFSNVIITKEVSSVLNMVRDHLNNSQSYLMQGRYYPVQTYTTVVRELSTTMTDIARALNLQASNDFDSTSGDITDNAYLQYGRLKIAQEHISSLSEIKDIDNKPIQVDQNLLSSIDRSITELETHVRNMHNRISGFLTTGVDALNRSQREEFNTILDTNKKYWKLYEYIYADALSRLDIRSLASVKSELDSFEQREENRLVNRANDLLMAADNFDGKDQAKVASVRTQLAQSPRNLSDLETAVDALQSDLENKFTAKFNELKERDTQNTSSTDDDLGTIRPNDDLDSDGILNSRDPKVDIDDQKNNAAEIAAELKRIENTQDRIVEDREKDRLKAIAQNLKEAIDLLPSQQDLDDYGIDQNDIPTLPQAVSNILDRSTANDPDNQELERDLSQLKDDVATVLQALKDEAQDKARNNLGKESEANNFQPFIRDDASDAADKVNEIMSVIRTQLSAKDDQENRLAELINDAAQFKAARDILSELTEKEMYGLAEEDIPALPTLIEAATDQSSENNPDTNDINDLVSQLGVLERGLEDALANMKDRAERNKDAGYGQETRVNNFNPDLQSNGDDAVRKLNDIISIINLQDRQRAVQNEENRAAIEEKARDLVTALDNINTRLIEDGERPINTSRFQDIIERVNIEDDPELDAGLVQDLEDELEDYLTDKFNDIQDVDRNNKLDILDDEDDLDLDNSKNAEDDRVDINVNDERTTAVQLDQELERIRAEQNAEINRRIALYQDALAAYNILKDYDSSTPDSDGNVKGITDIVIDMDDDNDYSDEDIWRALTENDMNKTDNTSAYDFQGDEVVAKVETAILELIDIYNDKHDGNVERSIESLREIIFSDNSFIIKYNEDIDKYNSEHPEEANKAKVSLNEKEDVTYVLMVEYMKAAIVNANIKQLVERVDLMISNINRVPDYNFPTKASIYHDLLRTIDNSQGNKISFEYSAAREQFVKDMLAYLDSWGISGAAGIKYDLVDGNLEISYEGDEIDGKIEVLEQIEEKRDLFKNAGLTGLLNRFDQYGLINGWVDPKIENIDVEHQGWDLILRGQYTTEKEGAQIDPVPTFYYSVNNESFHLNNQTMSKWYLEFQRVTTDEQLMSDLFPAGTEDIRQDMIDGLDLKFATLSYLLTEETIKATTEWAMHRLNKARGEVIDTRNMTLRQKNEELVNKALYYEQAQELINDIQSKGLTVAIIDLIEKYRNLSEDEKDIWNQLFKEIGFNEILNHVIRTVSMKIIVSDKYRQDLTDNRGPIRLSLDANDANEFEVFKTPALFSAIANNYSYIVDSDNEDYDKNSQQDTLSLTIKKLAMLYQYANDVIIEDQDFDFSAGLPMLGINSGQTVTNQERQILWHSYKNGNSQELVVQTSDLNKIITVSNVDRLIRYHVTADDISRIGISEEILSKYFDQVNDAVYTYKNRVDNMSMEEALNADILALLENNELDAVRDQVLVLIKILENYQIQRQENAVYLTADEQITSFPQDLVGGSDTRIPLRQYDQVTEISTALADHLTNYVDIPQDEDILDAVADYCAGAIPVSEYKEFPDHYKSLFFNRVGEMLFFREGLTKETFELLSDKVVDQQQSTVQKPEDKSEDLISDWNTYQDRKDLFDFDRDSGRLIFLRRSTSQEKEAFGGFLENIFSGTEYDIPDVNKMIDLSRSTFLDQTYRQQIVDAANTREEGIVSLTDFYVLSNPEMFDPVLALATDYFKNNPLGYTAKEMAMSGIVAYVTSRYLNAGQKDKQDIVNTIVDTISEQTDIFTHNRLNPDRVKEIVLSSHFNTGIGLSDTGSTLNEEISGFIRENSQYFALIFRPRFIGADAPRGINDGLVRQFGDALGRVLQ